MKKYLILLLIILLVGCSKNKTYENVKIDFFELNLELNVEFKDDCKNSKELYFENENEKIYFICANDVSFNNNEDEYEFFLLEDIKDYFAIYSNILYNNEMIVYISNEASNEDIDNIKNELQKMNISEIEYMSKEDIYNSYKEELEMDIDIDINYLNSYFIIYINDVSNMKKYANEIGKISNVDEVDYASSEDCDVSGNLIDSFLSVIKKDNDYKENNNIIEAGNLKFIKCSTDNKNILYISHRNNKNVDNICK